MKKFTNIFEYLSIRTVVKNVKKGSTPNLILFIFYIKYVKIESHYSIKYKSPVKYIIEDFNFFNVL